MLDLKAERREETAMIKNINEKLKEILTNGDYQPKNYTGINLSTDRSEHLDRSAHENSVLEGAGFDSNSMKTESVALTEVGRGSVVSEDVDSESDLMGTINSGKVKAKKKKRSKKNADLKKKIKK